MFDKLKKRVGDVVDKLKNKVEEKKEEKKKDNKLRKIQGEFIKAKGNYSIDLMDEREEIYLGTHEVDDDVNNATPRANTKRKANNVVNMVYEFVESQIDTLVPMPAVKSKRRGYEAQAQVIEDCIKSDFLESDINRINDENERTTPVQGFSIITVDWNPDFKHHLYRGEIELDNRHPKTLIPQPGVYNIQKMDYFFLVSTVSKDFIKRRYGVEIEDETEEYPEYNSISGTSDNNNQDNDNLTVVTKWFKDDDGKIGKFTYCNDTVLEDIKHFYARRLKHCLDCDSTVYDDECEQCGSKRTKSKVEEYETLEEDVARSDGSVIPAMSPQIDDMGMPVLDEMGQPTMEPTRIKYFCPTRYPVIIRKNVPLPFNFGGQSDVDVVRDQQDALKKVISTIEEKILRGGVIIKAKNGHNINLKNQLYQVIKGEQDELANLSTMDIRSDIQQDLQFAMEQYKSAQNTLGITDSFQGKPDRTAQSGVAKQIQVFQSSGRMQSKLFNKRNAFKELFEIMFEFKLAFCDEIRPFMKQGKNGMPEYGEFNKYDFLEQDAAGEWYYNTDFLFSAEAGEGIPKDKMWLMNQTLMYTQSGLLSKVQFWAAMEKLGYPSASDYKQQAEEEAKMMAEQQQQQMQMQQEQQQAQAAQKQQENEVKQQEGDFNKQMDIMKMVQEQMKINGDRADRTP